MQPDSAPELPRETGGFRLLRTLGRGGMGVVYEAEELASGRRVALKILAREHALSEEAFERFRREAKIAASVSDSGCVFVFGAHQIEGSPAIAMELCGGETLEHRMRRGEVPIADAVRWTIEILDGLEAAHRSGIVHRDVKPSNCFITTEGRIKVGDFGLARSLVQDVQLTQSGAFVGSPLYASPEQIKGRPVDFKSDIYSTGATLYALLAGRSPYLGVNLGEVLSRILSEPPDPLSEKRKGVPPELEKIVLRAMARDPSARYPSHAAMREALRPFAETEARAAHPLRRFCAFMIDGALLALLNLPLVGIWARIDSTALQPVGTGTVQLQSPHLQLVTVLMSMLYFTLAEGLFRRTIGKWITGQRVVVVGSPESERARPYLRALLWTGGAFVISLLRFLPAAEGITAQAVLASGLFNVVVALALLSTMRRRNGWRGIHELLSKTRVVAEPLPFERLVARRAPPPSRLEPADLAPARFGEYAIHGRVGKTASGEVYEASDPELDRRVWIHAPAAGAAELIASRRSLDRPTRLRWLDAIDVGGRRHEVFEAPGGAKLRDCAADKGGIDWPTTHRVLSTLAEELETPDAPRTTIDQLWIDRAWNLRILDEPLGEDAARTKPEPPLQLLAHVARECTAAGDARLPPDLPEHAEPVVRSLIGLENPFRSLADVRRELGRLAGRPQGLTWKIRGLQMLVASGLVVMAIAIMLLSVEMIVLPQIDEVGESITAMRELRGGRVLTHVELMEDKKKPSGRELGEEDRRNRRILIADIQKRLPAFSRSMSVQFAPEDRNLFESAQAEFGAATPEEIAVARAAVLADRPADFDPQSTKMMRIVHGVRYVLPVVGSAVFLVFSVLLAFAFRGGLSFRFLSIAVRNPRGSKAGRFRCAWRAIATALPLFLLYAVPLALYLYWHPVLAFVALSVAIIVHVGLVIVSLRNPTRGWQDRVAGTRLVPR